MKINAFLDVAKERLVQASKLLHEAVVEIHPCPEEKQIFEILYRWMNELDVKKAEVLFQNKDEIEMYCVNNRLAPDAGRSVGLDSQQ